MDQRSSTALEDRVVRYAALKPCFNAFIDTRSPGSETKENFTIIGPGVSENPEQHVHIAEPHGFNIGGARQPPGCVNSQHSHDTAEVFVAHTGTWRFDLGEHGDDAQVVLHPGDVISLPTRMFRGFTNVGDASGFLWAVLGQDDPGRVTWAPQVFDMASEYGLVLLESGRLVDTTKGEGIPEGRRPMQRTTPEQVGALRRYSQAEAETLVVRSGSETAKVIGASAPLGWEHGFELDRWLVDGVFPEDASGSVLFVHEGTLTVSTPDDEVTLAPGDTITLPVGHHRPALHGDAAVVFAVRRT